MIPETSFGHKAANLVKLDQLCHSLTLTGVHVCVPPYLCFSHQEIFGHIRQFYPAYLEDWQVFVSLQAGNALFPSEARLHLWKMQEALIQLFAAHIFTTAALEDFLRLYRDKNATLMVRSTGREDSETFSNAGGNRSESGVIPEREAVSAAIGKVIASYHSVKSLRLRKFGDDDIAASPFLSVFLQEMIGEVYECNQKLDIPVSGILHTQEMLGHTPDMIQLQALYGHNEALVKNLLPYDTFYITTADVHSVVQFKKKRLVSSLTGEFVSVDNPWEMRMAPTLSSEILDAFLPLATHIQNFFGEPIEVEWTYSHSQHCLYLVQARPLIAGKQQLPSFINQQNLFNTYKQVRVCAIETIVSKGSVTLLTHASEWIHDVTLEKGFSHYLREEKPQIKALFCQIPAAATSHAACSLREQNIEVFSGAELPIQELSKVGTVSLVDPQQGKIFIFEHSVKHANEFSAELKQAGIIEEGWLSHPVPALESILPFLEANVTTKRITPINGVYDEKRIHQLLRQAIVSNEAVDELLNGLHTELEKLRDQSVFFERAMLIAQQAQKIADHYLYRERPRMQRLYALKRLEALFFQNKSAQIMHSDSLSEILREHQSIFAMGKYLLHSEGKERWQIFTESLLRDSPDVIKRLETLVNEVERLHITEEWINIAFMHTWQTQPKQTSHEILGQLELELKELFPLIHYLFDARKILQQWKERIPLWSDYKRFESLYFDFSHHFLRDLHELTNLFFMTPAENWLGRTMLIHFIQEAIEVYDQILKALKGSPEYIEKSLKVTRFKKMLEPFLALMKIWVEQIPAAKIAEWIRTIESLGDKLPGDYRQTVIRAIERQFNYLTSTREEHLWPSKEFNVNAQVISSAYYKNQDLPLTCTLEDLCTLIHQNILVAQMTHFTSLWEGRLPAEMTGLHQQVLGMQKKCEIRPGVIVPIQANWVGLSYAYPVITLLYNVPVKNHSTVIRVSYHLEEKAAEIDVRMIGHNRGGRMEEIAKNIFIQSLAAKCPLVVFPQYDAPFKMLEFMWKLSQNALEKQALLSSIHKILLKALEDTLLDKELIPVKLEELDFGQKEVWSPLWATHGQVQKWFGYGAPYFQPLMKHFLKHQWYAEALLLFPLDQNLLTALPINDQLFQRVNALLHSQAFYFSAYGNEQGFHGYNELSEWALKDFFTQEEAVQLLVKHRNQLLYRPQEPFDTKMFFLALHFIILNALIQAAEDQQVTEYLEFLKGNQQIETVVDLYYNRKKWHFTAPQEEIVRQASLGKNVDGYPVSAETIEKALSVMDFMHLQKDAVLFIQVPRTQTWVQATVIKVLTETSPEEPFGSIKVRVARGGIIKITHPYNIKISRSMAAV